MLNISFTLANFTYGLLQASALVGAAIGAVIFGRLCDKVGRKKMLMLNLIFFVFNALLSALAWNIGSLIFFRFLVGLSVGMDYPICATYLSEMIPPKKSAIYTAAAFFANHSAAPVGVLVAWLIFTITPINISWRWMFASCAIPSIIALILRLKIPESFLWKARQKIINNQSIIEPYRQLFNPQYFKVTFILGACWFLMDISYYGMLLFTPLILSDLNTNFSGNFFTNMTETIQRTLYVSSYWAAGSLISIWIINKVKLGDLQKKGFFRMFYGLILISLSGGNSNKLNILLTLTGFVIFNFFNSMGPTVTTYFLPAKAYPTEIRATGHGLATGIGKLGAFLGVITLPILVEKLGLNFTMFILSLTALGGYLLTRMLPQNLVE